MSERVLYKKPTFTILGKQRSMNIGTGTIRLLNCPSHIAILRGINNKSIAITPCEPSHVMSFKVPEHFMKVENVKFMIHSKAFTEEVLKYCGLDPSKTYTFEGEYDEQHNRVIFEITNGQPFPNRKTNSDQQAE